MRLMFVLLLCCLAGCATRPAQHGIPNFGVVDAGLARGGEPTREGWVWLKQNGYTNIVKLNTESEASDLSAKAMGMRVAYIPITTCQQIFGPVSPQLRIALTNLYLPGSYVHCSFGKNRTGDAVMLYRVEHDHWSKRDAKREALSYGWGDSLPALRVFWWRVKDSH